MPIEAAEDGAIPVEASAAPDDTRAARHAGFRLAFSPALVFACGLILGWPVFFLAAVFAALFAQAPARMPTAAALRLLGVTSLMLALAWGLATGLSPYPFAFLSGIVLALVLVFRMAANGANALVVVLALLAALLVPFLVKTSPTLAGLVSVWLVLNLGIAMVASWMVFRAFPAPSPASPPEPKEAPAFDPDRRLIRMCLVTIPFAVFFFALESGAALVLVFVAILTTQLAASSAAGPVVARTMMAANLLGGLVAILIYEALVMAPFLPLAILLVLTACAFFAERSLAGNALAGSALTATLVLVGGSLGPISDGAEVKMLARLWQIGLALIYILTAFVLVDRWLPERSMERREE